MAITVRSGAPSVARPDPAPRHRRPAPDLLMLAAITVLAVVLRFATITHQSYWVDEATTVHEVGLSFGAMLHAVHAGESTPPLYFVLAWVWATAFGTGELALRSLSALLGIGLVPIAYACGRELVSRWTGVVAAALTAVSPFLIWYSQEARAYMLLGALCGLSFLGFARMRRGPDRRALVLWGVSSALAVLTHYFAGFLVAPEAAVLLWWRRDRPTVLAVGAVAAVQAAMVPLIVGAAGRSLIEWISAFSLSTRINQVAVELSLSTLYRNPLVSHGLLGAGVLALVLALLLAFGGGRARLAAVAPAAAVAAFVLVVPVLLALAGHDYVVPRNFIGAWVPLAVVFAAAVTAPRTLPAGAALAALVLVAFLYAGALIDSRTQYQRPDWRGVAGALGAASGQRAIVAYAGGTNASPLSLYLPGVPWHTPPGPLTVSEVDVVGDAYQQAPARLPAGVRLISTSSVADFTVARYAVPRWRLTPAAIGARAATALLVPGPAAPAVLVQRAPTHR